MELKDRLHRILQEQNLKQKEFADTIRVTEGYVSNILNGKRNRLSDSLAFLIEQKYGYSAHWLLTGEGECYATQSALPGLSPAKKRLISEIEKMTDSEIDAIKVFIDSLDEYKKAFHVYDVQDTN